jgi:hypothetical protein
MTFNVEIDVTNVRNPCCQFYGVAMENILDKKNVCSKCQTVVQTQADIEVVLHSKMVENLVKKVNLMTPNKMRGEIENMLMMGFDLNLIHQIDLAALLQEEDAQSVYWNMIMWFKYLNLPVNWLSPYIDDIHPNSPETFWDDISEAIHDPQDI